MLSRTLAPTLRQTSRAPLSRAIRLQQSRRFINSEETPKEDLTENPSEDSKDTPLIRYERSPSNGLSRPKNPNSSYESAPTLYKAHAKVTLGPEGGNVEGENLKVDLAMPKELGGAGEAGKTNSEELFAAAFAASYLSTMKIVAPRLGITLSTDPADLEVEGLAQIIGNLETHNLGLRFRMKIQARGMDQDTLDSLIRESSKKCPYSKSMRGRIWIQYTGTIME